MIVNIHDKVFICDEATCNSLAKQSDIYSIIHIYRSDFPKNTCDFATNNNFINDANYICIDYMDGHELSESTINRIFDFVRANSNKKIAVHCHAGKTRSPTIAVLVLSILNDITILDSLNIIYKEYYFQTKQLPNITMLPLESMLGIKCK